MLPWVEAATGSLRHCIGIGVGMALSGKYLDRLPYRTWLQLDDSEMAEGSVWAEFDKAAYYRLNHLIAILDMNRLGQRGETELGWNGAAYASRARAFGWHAIELDGHDLRAIDAAFAEAVAQQEAPVCLIAKTIKGRGVKSIENINGWHGKALPPKEAEAAIAELGGERQMVVSVVAPERQAPAAPPETKPLKLPVYRKGTREATRKAYGDALAALGANRSEVVVSTAKSRIRPIPTSFSRPFPTASSRCSSPSSNWSPRPSDWRCEASRRSLRRLLRFSAARSATSAWPPSRTLRCGFAARTPGVSIGEDSPSQMGLEDLAMMLAVFGCTVLYLCNANQTARLVEQMADTEGVSYLRTTRGKTDAIYDDCETFAIGGSKVLRQSDRDDVAAVAAGITVHEALNACEQLAVEGIHLRVIDAYSVKPIDRQTIIQALRAAGGRVIVVEDHWLEGGLGSAVLEALAGDETADLAWPPIIVQLAVREMPGSGKLGALLAAAGIGAEHIASAARTLAKRRVHSYGDS